MRSRRIIFDNPSEPHRRTSGQKHIPLALPFPGHSLSASGVQALAAVIDQMHTKDTRPASTRGDNRGYRSGWECRKHQFTGNPHMYLPCWSGMCDGSVQQELRSQLFHLSPRKAQHIPHVEINQMKCIGIDRVLVIAHELHARR